MDDISFMPITRHAVISLATYTGWQRPACTVVVVSKGALVEYNGSLVHWCIASPTTVIIRWVVELRFDVKLKVEVFMMLWSWWRWLSLELLVVVGWCTEFEFLAWNAKLMGLPNLLSQCAIPTCRQCTQWTERSIDQSRPRPVWSNRRVMIERLSDLTVELNWC